jgi:hypothetical protein
MGPMGPSFSQEGVFKIIVCTVLICGTNGTSGTIIFSRGRAQNCHMCCSNLLAQWYQWDHDFLERESSTSFHVLYWWDQWDHLFQHHFMYCTNGTNGTIFWGDWGRVWNCIMYFTDLWDQWYHYFLGRESSKIVLCSILMCGTNRTIIFSDWRVQCCIMYCTDLWDQWDHHFVGEEGLILVTIV